MCKVHDVEKAKEIKRAKRAKLFTTTSAATAPGERAKEAAAASDWRAVKHEFETLWKVGVDYVQVFEDVSTRGLAFEYASLLNLTKSQANSLSEYMRYWQILRRCCGAQMSTDYRHRPLESRLSTV